MASALSASLPLELLARLGFVPPERIVGSPTPGTATEADLLRQVGRTGIPCELVDGVLLEKAAGFLESWRSALLAHALMNHLRTHPLGILGGAKGALRLAPGLVRAPDISFISWERLPGRRVPSTPIPDLAPDLAVEILRQGNTRAEMDRKLRDYFGAGTRLVWIVDPLARATRVYTSPEQFIIVDEQGKVARCCLASACRLDRGWMPLRRVRLGSCTGKHLSPWPTSKQALIPGPSFQDATLLIQPSCRESRLNDLLLLQSGTTYAPALNGHVLHYEVRVCAGNRFERFGVTLYHLEEHYRALAVYVLASKGQRVVIATAIGGHGPVPVWVMPTVVKDEERLKALQEAEHDSILDLDAIVLLNHLEVRRRPPPAENLTKPHDTGQLRLSPDASFPVSVVLDHVPNGLNCVTATRHCRPRVSGMLHIPF